MEEKTKRPITITKKVYISPTWGDASLKPIATHDNSLYLTEVINRSKFGVDWFSSFGSGEVQNLRFAIGTTSGPYHCSAAALARDNNSAHIHDNLHPTATCYYHYGDIILADQSITTARPKLTQAVSVKYTCFASKLYLMAQWGELYSGNYAQ